MDQQRAGTLCIRKLRTRSVFAIVGSLLLCVMAQLNAFAQPPNEMNIQIAQLATTVKCGAVENYLALVKASAPNAAAPGNAFGLVLSPTNGEARMFARYWFFVQGNLDERRDDDAGKPSLPLPARGDRLKANADEFLKGCASENERSVLSNLIIQATQHTSIEEAVKSLNAAGLQFKNTHPSNQNLTQPLDNADGQAAFSTAIRTSLRQHNWRGAASSDGEKDKALADVAARLETIERKLETMTQGLDSRASRQNLLLTILTFFFAGGAVLVVALLCLFYLRPNWRRRFFSDPEFTREIGVQTAGALQHSNLLKTPEEKRTDTVDNPDTDTLRKFIDEHFGKKYLEQGVQRGLKDLATELKKTLSPLASADSNGSLTLNRLQSARDQVKTMWERYSSNTFENGALTTLQKDWISLQDTLETFKSKDFKDRLVLTRESAALFQYLSDRFRNETQKPEDVLREVKELLNKLDEVYNEFTQTESRTSLAPVNLLVDLRINLQRQKDLNESAARTIRTVLPNQHGAINELAAELVNEFKANTDVEKTKNLENSVSDLQSELSALKRQAEESMELAGELSHYVRLSPNAQLEPKQVYDILRRFKDGESSHRLLRLRLSAAITALNQAVEEVKASGRDDVISELRIDEFKDPLEKLLADLEDYGGDALWKQCLSSGFARRWLHALLRAELLARTYFADHQSLSLLIAPLTEAATAFRETISRLNVCLTPVTLLVDPPPGVPTSAGRENKLSELSEVRKKVLERLEQQERGEDPTFIVDVESFPYESDSNLERGEVIPASSSLWTRDS